MKALSRLQGKLSSHLKKNGLGDGKTVSSSIREDLLPVAEMFKFASLERTVELPSSLGEMTLKP